MFVGHACLAFAVAALGADRLGWSRERSLQVAVLAALFATLPDVDVVYGLSGLVAPAAGAGSIPVESFWDAGNRVHRGVTHALPVAAVVTAAVWLAGRVEPTSRAAGATLLAALVPTVAAIGGALAGAVTAVFVLCVGGLVALARRRDVSSRVLAGAAFVGLFTHPFGDLFTGSPPALLYPFDATLVAERVVLSADPTLHLLGAFGVELATVWLALAAYFRISGERPAAHVDRRAVLGVAYAGAALALPAPTLEVSYHFVFSVLAVGFVGVAPPSLERVRSWRAGVTALATISLAAVAYAAVYLVVG
ncbi:metal-dependent hydrolase [Halosimplex pelagicum]|uniref:Metal-dependent hydrolase n=1 Tax=Halosimplex pelagicum TaxID=869886 RepID=A0A7D5STS9_9EURY|nr:metal-dependent hydrolase [Halosimplex pelagicum]QLH80727.1 metal-dependent hydrolase [Halosimplex pelagicum]